MSGVKKAMGAVRLQQAIDLLTECYASVIEGGLSVSILPSAMLWGPPGIGKSQGVRQFAERLGERTNRRVFLTDVRLILFNPVDLRGIPTANADRTLAVWLKPAVFDMDPSEDSLNVLFLDELSAAPPSVQAAAYQIALDRRIGEHVLPDNCIVIAAGNRITDRSVAFKMPKALANRLCHFEIAMDFPTWKDWAVRQGIDSRVLGFLTFRPDRLMCFDAATDELAFPTPRTWEMTSNILRYACTDEERALPLVAGCVGEGAATEFITWASVFALLPSIEGIFKGTEHTVPRSTDALYALVSSMTTYASEHTDDEDGIERSVVYATRMPPDFTAVLIRDYLRLGEGMKSILMRSQTFLSWADKRKGLLDG
jgi:hypothetical protein